MKIETFHKVCEAHCEVESELGFGIDAMTTWSVLGYCIRKLKRIGKDEDYLPILYRCELPMQLAMREINRRSEAMLRERKGGERYVRNMPTDDLSIQLPQCP